MTPHFTDDLKPFAGFGMVAGSLEITHLPTGRTYLFHAVVLRETDCTAMALYGKPLDVMWTRPLKEILHSDRWEWDQKWNPFMSMLARALQKYEVGLANG
jgi:hypothetical protein